MPTQLPLPPHGTLAWLSAVRAYNLCEAVMTARLAAIGLRVGEHEVLATVATTPGITQQALAARCFVAKSGISMLIAHMESLGWVLRDSDAADARVKRLSLTPAGLAMAQQSLQVQADVVLAMVGDAPDADLATVTRVMDIASEALETLRAAPPPETIGARAAKAKAR